MAQIPIELTPSTMWCQQHLANFAQDWPRGYAVATPLLFTAFVGLDQVQRYCGFDADGGLADTTRLQSALSEFGPCCCAIASDLRMRIVTAARGGDADAIKALNDEIVAANFGGDE